MRHYLGVDPGTGGAAVIISDEREVLAVQPWEGESSFEELVANHKPALWFSVTEKVGAMPGNAGSSMFRFGFNAGFIQGVLMSHRLRFGVVTPQTWQKNLGLPRTKEKRVHKNNLKDLAQRELPGHRWTLKTADAALLALHALKTDLSPSNSGS